MDQIKPTDYSYLVVFFISVWDDAIVECAVERVIRLISLAIQLGNLFDKNI